MKRSDSNAADERASSAARVGSASDGTLRRAVSRWGRNLLRAATLEDSDVVFESDPDVRLMLAVQQGDEAAFEQLFAKHVGPAIGFAWHFVGERARAEEIVQEAFLQIYRVRHRYVPRSRFRTWLYRIVANACVSELRRPQHRHRRVTSSNPGREPWEVPGIGPRNSEEILLNREAVGKMRQALANLPPQQRAALLLARVEGMSYEEIATSLRCSVSAVKSLIHRATVTLRAQVREEEP